MTNNIMLKTSTSDTVSFKSAYSNYSIVDRNTMKAFWAELEANKGNLEFKVEDTTYKFTITNFDKKNYKEQPIEYKINDYKGEEVAQGVIKNPQNHSLPIEKKVFYKLLPIQYEQLSKLVEEFITITKAPREEIINDYYPTQLRKMEDFLNKDPRKIYEGAWDIIDKYAKLDDSFNESAVSYLDRVYETLNERYQDNVEVTREKTLGLLTNWIKQATKPQLNNLVKFIQEQQPKKLF